MRGHVAILVLFAFALSACGSGVSVPTPVRGVWGADCASPYIGFSQDSVHVYADNATYAIDSITFDGNNLTVKYTSPQGEISETYMKSGETLRLDRGSYGGAETASHKPPMNRCG